MVSGILQQESVLAILSFTSLVRQESIISKFSLRSVSMGSSFRDPVGTPIFIPSAYTSKDIKIRLSKLNMQTSHRAPRVANKEPSGKIEPGTICLRLIGG